MRRATGTAGWGSSTRSRGGTSSTEARLVHRHGAPGRDVHERGLPRSPGGWNPLGGGWSEKVPLRVDAGRSKRRAALGGAPVVQQGEEPGAARIVGGVVEE